MVKPFLSQAEISKTLRESKSISHEIFYWMAFSTILDTRKTFTSEDVMAVVERKFVPDQPGWWGAMFQVMTKRALASGLIRKTKETQKAKRPSSNRRKLKVWEVLAKGE
jgi:hypothetical protein